MNTVQELDKKLFESYLKPKMKVITGLVRGGILSSKMDWYETPQPKGTWLSAWENSGTECPSLEIRPYMFETLMFLVGVHAQVSSAAAPLLERALGALVDDLADECLRCFRQVKRFGMGGMLRVCIDSTPNEQELTRLHQATLEIEFMHQTLSRHVSTSAAKTLSELYTKISQAYQRRPGDENLQGNLDIVKKTLADTRRATGIEFLCFRQTKERSAKTPVAPTPRKEKSSRAKDEGGGTV